MELTANQRKFRNISIVLIIVGFISMGVLAGPIWAEIFQSRWFPQCYKELQCNLEGLEYPLRNNIGYLRTMVGGWLSMNTTGVFAESNAVNYLISIKVDNPQYVKAIFVLINMDDQSNFKFLENKTYEIAKVYLETNEIRNIPLYHTSPSFFTNTNQTEFDWIGNVTFYALVVDDRNVCHLAKFDGPSFSLKSYESSLLAKQSIDDENSGKVILALTMMAVTLAPVLLGADYLGRIYLYES